MINLGIPQVIFLAVALLSLGVGLAKHGEDKEVKYNFWASLISMTIIIALLAWGGFFS